MVKFYDIDTPVRINGGLTVNGDTTIPSSFNLYVGGNITGNSNIYINGNITGNVSTITTMNGTTANITNVNSTGIISGGTIKGNGSQITNLSSSAMPDVLLLNGTRSMAGNLTMPILTTSGNMNSYQINFRDTGHNIKWQYQLDDNTTSLDGLRVAGYSGVELYTNSAHYSMAVFKQTGSYISTPLTLSGNTTLYGALTSSTTISTSGTLSGGTIIGNGSSITVNNNSSVSGGTNPISTGWAYTHENKIGSQGHIPTGGTNTTFLRGDNTWVTPTDTNTYVTGLSSTSGGNGNLTLTRNTGGNLSLDLTHNHDSSYYTQTQVDSKLTSKDYYGKWTINVTGNAYDVNSSGNITITGNGATTVSMSGGTIAISSTDNNTWRGIDTTPVSGDTTNSIASSWAYTHQNTYGLGSHVPSGGSAITFLRGDGTWVTPTDTNTYVTGLSSTAGGNGTLTVTRNTGGNLSIDLSHNHDSTYLKLAGGTLTGNLTINASSYADRVYQNWNGTPTSNLGSPSLAEMAFLDKQFTNKTWFYDPTLITFDYTMDGVTWTPQTVSTTTIADFVSGRNNTTINIPNKAIQFRITINNNGSYVYLNALYMYWSSQSHSTKVTIEKSLADGTNTWATHTSSTNSVSAWPGHLYLPFSTIPFNKNNTVQYTAIRIVFTPTWSSDPTYGTYPIALNGMEVWGGYPSGFREIYSWDRDKNVTFPAQVTSTSFIGSGNSLTVGGTPINNSVNPINAGWAYTHANSYGLGSHVPSGGTSTTFLRGDNTWVTPTDTNTYTTGISSTSGGNGTLTVTRNTGGNLTLNLAHNHDSSYLGINAKAVDSDKLDSLDSSQFLRSDVDDIMGGILTLSGSVATPLVIQRNGSPNVNLQFIHSSGNGFLGIDLTGQLKFGSIADLNASGYKVWHENNFTPSSKLDVTTFSTHTGNTGIGSHIPTGGDTTKFLRGDGTWQVASIADTYVTGISSTSGGNGTLTINRNNTMADLTLDLTHNHDSLYLGINGTSVNSTKFNNLSSNQFVRNDSTTTMSVGLLFSSTATGGVLSSTPTALSYGVLQAYGTLNILADTDASHTEYLYLSAGYPTGASTNGLAIGYTTFTWKGNTIWHSGNMGMGSGLDADKLDGQDSSYYVYVGQNNLFKNMSGGVHYDSAVDMNTLQTVGEYRFINIASSGSANMPTGSSGMGYYFGMGGGDVGSRGFQLLGTSAKQMYFRDMSNLTWCKIWNDQNDGAGSGLDADTIDAIQSSQLVRNDLANQTVNTGFTMSSNAYVGMSNGAGALYVRTGAGSVGLQLAGDNSAKQSGVGVYLAANGTATFSGTMTANTIAVTSTALVTNLNAQMINSIKEPQLTKNQSIFDISGKGVQVGLLVSAQGVPNMTVQIATGTVYTDSGMRIVIPSATNVSFSAPSATYNRIDSVYIQGSSSGANEGVVTVMTGVAQANPVAPTIPSDGVLLANVTIRQNAGSILSTDITDMRQWKNLFNLNGDTYINNNLYVQGTINSTNGYISLSQPVKNSKPNNSVTISAGSTTYTWTHNLNLSQYVVRLSCNNPEPHVTWSNKVANAITVNLDNAYDTDTVIDISIEAF